MQQAQPRASAGSSGAARSAATRPAPKRGSQPRGEDSRHRILAAALGVFAAEGYEGTTTRRLADVAQVNLPAIQYYFGSKDGLFRAVVDELIATMESRVGPAADTVNAALAEGKPPRRKLIALLNLMLDTFVALVTDQSVPDWTSRAMFFARAEIEPSPALEPMHDWIRSRLVGPCSALVAALTGEAPDAETTTLRTLALMGQVTIFCNQKAARMLGWQQIDPERVCRIQDVVRAHTRAIFRSPKKPNAGTA